MEVILSVSNVSVRGNTVFASDVDVDDLVAAVVSLMAVVPSV